MGRILPSQVVAYIDSVIPLHPRARRVKAKEGLGGGSVRSADASTLLADTLAAVHTLHAIAAEVAATSENSLSSA